MSNTVEPIEVGDPVWYFDPEGKQHYALVTAIWGKWEYSEEDREYNPGLPEKPAVPSINLVYVEKDPMKHDPYGNQIARNTSVVHKSNQAAFGMYWINI